MKVAQAVDKLEDPVLVGRQWVNGCQDISGDQLFEDKFALARPPKQLDNVETCVFLGKTRPGKR